jgi:dihydroorotate dehydrogenase
LGKSKITPIAEAAGDYLSSFVELWEEADFFVVNVSSPNTPNLRQLQDREALKGILTALQDRNRLLAAQHRTSKPVLVKVAPDLSWEALDEIVEVALSHSLAGIVACNTTLTRPSSSDPVSAQLYRETGGLSGRPLRHRSTELVRHLYRQSGGKLQIVGVGGINSAADAWEKILAGASLVQIYSALVFNGPLLVREIVLGLHERLSGAKWEDVVGAEAR